MSKWAFEGSNFVVQDIRNEIRKYRNPNYPYGWRGKGTIQDTRKLEDIDHINNHQTAGSIPKGIKGPLNTARFVNANPWFKCVNEDCINYGNTWEGNKNYPSTRCPKCAEKGRDLCVGRGFPDMCYSVFNPFNPEIADNGKFIIYWCVDFVECTWQGGEGSNPTGVGVGWQGLFSSRHQKKFKPKPVTDGNPSLAQQQLILPIWREWLMPTLNLTQLSQIRGHFQYGKPTCPGDYIENKIREFWNTSKVQIYEIPEDILGKYDLDSWEQRQAALVVLGYDLGKYGSKKNGVDGDPGDATRSAIESFQGEYGLIVDGVWDTQTEGAVIYVLDKKNISQEDIEKQI